MIGQVFSLTRCIVRSATNACSLESDSTNSKPFLDATILLGRFAWLLKINGSFLETALTVGNLIGHYGAIGKANQSNHQNANPSSYYTSYNQLQAAFDIADSDGDGLITYSEAVEVTLLLLYTIIISAC